MWGGWEYNETIHQLFIDFEKAYDSVSREFGVPMTILRLIKMCLNKTYSTVRIGKYVSDAFPIQSGIKQEMLYRHCFSAFLWNMPLGRSRKTRGD
jgi:hypothetical protein